MTTVQPAAVLAADGADVVVMAANNETRADLRRAAKLLLNLFGTTMAVGGMIAPVVFEIAVTIGEWFDAETYPAIDNASSRERLLISIGQCLRGPATVVLLPSLFSSAFVFDRTLVLGALVLAAANAVFNVCVAVLDPHLLATSFLSLPTILAFNLYMVLYALALPRSILAPCTIVPADADSERTTEAYASDTQPRRDALHLADREMSRRCLPCGTAFRIMLVIWVAVASAYLFVFAVFPLYLHSPRGAVQSTFTALAVPCFTTLVHIVARLLMYDLVQRLRSDTLWTLTFALQLLMAAAARVMVSGLPDATNQAVTSLVAGAVELIARATVDWRDGLGHRMLHCTRAPAPRPFFHDERITQLRCDFILASMVS